MARTKRTTQPYSFDDLDHRPFEDLARQLAWRMDVDWIRIEPVDASAPIAGRDIRGIERMDHGRRLTHAERLEGIAEAYAAMDERRAVKSVVRVGTV